MFQIILGICFAVIDLSLIGCVIYMDAHYKGVPVGIYLKNGAHNAAKNCKLFWRYIVQMSERMAPLLLQWLEDLIHPPTRHIFTEDLWVTLAAIVDEYCFRLLPYTLDAFICPFPSYIIIQFYTKQTIGEELALEIVGHLCTALDRYLRAYGLNMLYCPAYSIVGTQVTIHIYYCENHRELPSYQQRVAQIIANSTSPVPGALKVAVAPPVSKTSIQLGYSAQAWDSASKKVSLRWDYHRDPHLLIAGITGGGKTVMAQWVVYKLLKQGAILYVCDYKAGGDWTGACSNYAEYDDCDRVLSDFYDAFTATVQTGTPADKPMVLVFDEFNGYTLSKNSKDFKMLMDKIRGIAQMGRSYNFHLILVGQQFSSKVLETGIREQLSTRIYMGKTISTESANMLFPGCDIDKGAVLPAHRGYALTADRGFETFIFPTIDHHELLLAHIQTLGNP